MTADRNQALQALLLEAETAHGTFETTELGGVFDQEWPRWYAEYLVEHGVAETLARACTVDDLEAFLARTNGEYNDSGRKDTESWTAYTARRMEAEL